MRYRAVLLLTFLWVLGCGADSAGFTPNVRWSPCPVTTSGTTADAECATVAAPERWSDPDGPTIDLFVKRVRGASGSRGQLWLLAGGPGNAGNFFEQLLPLFTQYKSDLDIYLPDHRGTGRSTRLGCAGEDEGSPGGVVIKPEEFPACIAEIKATFGTVLEGLRTTEAAHDVKALIDATRAPEQEVFVYGRSYGTYLVQRYLQIAPAQATAIILDSTCALPGCSFPAAYELNHDKIGRLLLSRCAGDAFCSSKLPNPEAALAGLLDKLDTGHCNTQPGARDALRAELGFMLKDVTLRALIPAVIYRLSLCRPQDVTAIANLETLLTSAKRDTLNSPLLRQHIIYSELWSSPSPADEAAVAAALMFGGLLPNYLPYYATWPRYTPDNLVSGAPATKLPILMLHGELDPQTTGEFELAMRERLSGPLQRYIEIPLAAHGLINNSPLASRTDTTCGAILIGGFLTDPAAPLDTSCVADSRPIDFNGTPELGMVAFGTTDVWGD